MARRFLHDGQRFRRFASSISSQVKPSYSVTYFDGAVHGIERASSLADARSKAERLRDEGKRKVLVHQSAGARARRYGLRYGSAAVSKTYRVSQGEDIYKLSKKQLISRLRRAIENS